ncbi:putative oligopeptide transporter [Melampsora larici-populina 98AG31]|uniref:Putative oligopeptide transporter n=1 Tax=Melampsora larici-populina (strain 98AG31 / pathotype 3-4-7) TaxID=747676 RepID=F4RPZ0_MELLP|nr:putative oligopeptide transporter [Melampsora larici-populina 98AG31]EGG05649.1 putative oligopeptide transporter [Melampsora larici-populina 98AG31]
MRTTCKTDQGFHDTDSLNEETYVPVSAGPLDDFPILIEREDEDQSQVTVTLRSMAVGLITTCIGGAIAQVKLFVFKPVAMSVHALVLQVACLVLGRIVENIPGPRWWNPGPLSIKETVFSAIMATSGAAATLSVEVIGAQDLVFGKRPSFSFCLLLSLSIQMIGFGLAGLFRPFLIHPAKTAFPSIFPSISLFLSMSKNTSTTKKQVSMFKKVFTGVLIYETIPTYFAPALQAISPWCLTLPKSPIVTQLFGGSLVGEGLGVFSASLDWVLVDWCAMAFGIFFLSGAYRYNWFDGGNLPFISFELLNSNGTSYNFTQTVYQNGTENIEGVNQIGLPRFSTGLILGLSGILFASSSSITTGLLFHWEEISTVFKKNSDPNLEDPHRKLCKSNADVHAQAFVTLTLLASLSAFICFAGGDSGLAWEAVLTCLLASVVLSLASGIFFGEVGLQLPCNAVFQMLGGVLFPGNALGAMNFTMLGGTIVTKCTSTSQDLKLGQRFKLSGLSVAFSQVIGTLLGAIVHLGTMRLILDSQREVLLQSNGNGIYTSWVLTSLAAQSTTWGLFSGRLYSPGQIYAILPYCFIIGFLVPIPLFLLHKWKPKAGFNRLNVPLFTSSLFNCIKGATSGRMTAMFIGLYTQWFLKRHHSSWYQKYNYIISAALDGGTELAVLILSALVQGGAGFPALTMPTYGTIVLFSIFWGEFVLN